MWPFGEDMSPRFPWLWNTGVTGVNTKHSANQPERLFQARQEQQSPPEVGGIF